MSSAQSTSDFVEYLGNSEYQISFHAPRAVYGGIIGFKNSKKNHIESEFGVVLTVPGIRDSGNSTISIKGKSSDDVCKAKKVIESTVAELRKKLFVTHFTCAPACAENIKARFDQLKASVLAEGYPGIDESLFIETNKIHITFACCTLLDEHDRTSASQIFKDCCQEYVDSKTPIEVKVRGLKKFGDEKTDRTRVIFAGIESPLLQELADKVSVALQKAHFNNANRGITAKLHLTILNILYKKKRGQKSPGSFDATKLLEKYADFDFGSFTVSELHLSQMGSKDETGFYKAVCVVKF